MKSCIFVPVGRDIQHDSKYKGTHWRVADKIKRNYLIHACVYNEFKPQSNTYDKLSTGSGWKWQIVKNFLKDLDETRYEYIGFFDDDIVTDCDNINRGLVVARQANATVFQLSMVEGSECSHPVIKQQQGVSYTVTKFVEGMGTFIHSSLIPTFRQMLDFYEFKSGWGLDVVLASALKAKAIVVHEASMFHPPQTQKGSYYNKDEAFAEMRDIQHKIYPAWMKHKYNEDVGTCHYDDREYEKVKL